MNNKTVVAIAISAGLTGAGIDNMINATPAVDDPRVTLTLAEGQDQTFSYSMDVDGDGQFEMEWLGDPVYRFDGPTLGTFRAMERDVADSMTWYVRAQGPIMFDIHNPADSVATAHERPVDLVDFGIFGLFYGEGGRVLEYEDGITVWRWPGHGHWYYIPADVAQSVHFRYEDDGTQFLIYRLLYAASLR